MKLIKLMYCIFWTCSVCQETVLEKNRIIFSAYKFYCFTVHFDSLNVTHQLMHFQYHNILV